MVVTAWVVIAPLSGTGSSHRTPGNPLLVFFRSSHVLNKSFTFAYLPLKSNHHTSDVGATPFLFHLTAKAVFGEFFFSLGVNEVFLLLGVNDTFTLGVRLPTCQPTRKGLCGAKPKIRLHSGETILHNYSLLSLSLHRLPTWLEKKLPESWSAGCQPRSGWRRGEDPHRGPSLDWGAGSGQHRAKSRRQPAPTPGLMTPRPILAYLLTLNPCFTCLLASLLTFHPCLLSILAYLLIFFQNIHLTKRVLTPICVESWSINSTIAINQSHDAWMWIHVNWTMFASLKMLNAQSHLFLN